MKIEEAIKNAGYEVGKQIFLGMDVASSEFYDAKTGKYTLEKSGEGSYDSKGFIAYLQKLWFSRI